MNTQLAQTVLAHHDGRGGVHHDPERAHIVYQTSTMAALLAGIYDGDVTIADLNDRTPFAVVTRFAADTTIEVGSASKPEVTGIIDEQVPSENLLYAIRIEGTFRRISTRTVSEQTPPYPPLTEATAGQAESDFRDISGTLAGFRTPDYEQGISIAGYHLHFIDRTRTRGGHTLDFELDRAQISIAISSQLHLSLPQSGPFLDAALATDDLTARIHKTEG